MYKRHPRTAVGAIFCDQAEDVNDGICPVTRARLRALRGCSWRSGGAGGDFFAELALVFDRE
jgi:hypothetical protein